MAGKTGTGLTSLLQKILTLVWWGLLIITLISVFVPGARPSNNNPLFLEKIGILIIAGIYLFAIGRLKQILGTIVAKNPFVRENIARFKQIGYAIFLIGLIDTIITFPSLEGTILIGTPYGGIKPRIVIYLIFGLLALILGEIFNQGRQIKEENELTI